MAGSAGDVPSVVDQAARILAGAGHPDASADLVRVARSNDVSPDALAAAVVEVAGRRLARRSR